MYKLGKIYEAQQPRKELLIFLEIFDELKILINGKERVVSEEDLAKMGLQEIDEKSNNYRENKVLKALQDYDMQYQIYLHQKEKIDELVKEQEETTTKMQNLRKELAVETPLQKALNELPNLEYHNGQNVYFDIMYRDAFITIDFNLVKSVKVDVNYIEELKVKRKEYYAFIDNFRWKFSNEDLKGLSEAVFNENKGTITFKDSYSSVIFNEEFTVLESELNVAFELTETYSESDVQNLLVNFQKYINKIIQEGLISDGGSN